MRYAILADIHSNLTAFEAVLKDVERRGKVDQVWCLGDVVGYGPDPCQCIQLLRTYDPLCVMGNHDCAAIRRLDIGDFNPDAAAACRWTAEQLGPEEREYLENLPQKLCEGDFTLAHGSPREPIWEYLVSTASARINFAFFDSRFCLVGHSHVPLIFEQEGESDGCLLHPLPVEVPFNLGECRLIINPGGVGQPRDGDPRASYAIYDSDDRVIYHYRIPYDVAATQQRMVQHGLPIRLIDRLSYGW